MFAKATQLFGDDLGVGVIQIHRVCQKVSKTAPRPDGTAAWFGDEVGIRRVVAEARGQLAKGVNFHVFRRWKDWVLCRGPLSQITCVRSFFGSGVTLSRTRKSQRSLSG